MSEIIRPKGYEEIIKVFGEIKDIKHNLDYVYLKFLLPLAWDEKIKIRRFACHKKLKPIFDKIFNEELAGLGAKTYYKLLKDFGGCFNIRPKKGNPEEYSTHSWGIAIDLNVKDNPFGKYPNQPYLLVSIFEKYGFIWGGRWRKPDGMHFQFAEGY